MLNTRGNLRLYVMMVGRKLLLQLLAPSFTEIPLSIPLKLNNHATLKISGWMLLDALEQSLN